MPLPKDHWEIKAVIPAVSPKPKPHRCRCWRSLVPDPEGEQTLHGLRNAHKPASSASNHSHVLQWGFCSQGNDLATWGVCSKQNSQRRLQGFFLKYLWTEMCWDSCPAHKRRKLGWCKCRAAAWVSSGAGEPDPDQGGAAQNTPREGKHTQYLILEHLE